MVQIAGQKKKMKRSSKSTAHKSSAGKIANKKNNRLAKQGKLNKVDKKKKKKLLIQEQNNKQQQEANVLKEPDHSDNEVDDEDDDEEELDFCADHLKHLRYAKDFVNQDLSLKNKSRGKKRKMDSEDEEEDYEQQPRNFASHEANKNMKILLPLIDKGKVIRQMTEKEDKTMKVKDDHEDDHTAVSNGEDKNTLKDEKSLSTEDEVEMLKSLTPAQLFSFRKHKIASMKASMANLAHNVIEDPQNNIKKLKELRLMLGDSSPGVCLTVRKYATVSLLEVFKDIVPGYRLRVPTEKEMAQRVKKETKSLWDYEASFLLSYRIYLTFLELMAKGKPIPDKSFLTKHGITNFTLPTLAREEMSKVALRCLCDLLVNHPHFNYRDNIIHSIVPFMNHRKPELSEIACDAVKTVFKQDKTGDTILEIVKTIGRMTKTLHFDVHPQVLESFLVLKIKDIDLSTKEERKKMMKEEKRLAYSRRERKRLKQKEQLDKEMLETKAQADKKQKIKLHTEIIQAVFETYIRIIKKAADSVLLPAVLEGLARFSHLINIEYFDSLFSSLNNIIETKVLTDREMLLCMQTAFTILSGQGTVINIDPSRFYKHFYGALLSVHAGQTEETTAVVLECLYIMIHKRRKQMSQQRILAFIKRLSTLCLQLSSRSSIAFLSAIRQFVHAYKYSDILFDTEAPGSGLYLPDLQDPEHCCANGTSLWEFLLLQYHFDPDVQHYTQHMLHGAPLSGTHQLRKDLARKAPLELYESLLTGKAWENLPAKSPKKRRVMCPKEFASDQFSQYIESIQKRVAETSPQKIFSC